VRLLPALALALAGCDQGPRLIDPVAGPALRLVSSYPAHGEGLECSLAEPGCGVPTDARLELRFDRFLLPSTAVRQSIAFFSGAPSSVVPEDRFGPEIIPSYDPLERVVTFSLPPGATLQPNTLYTVRIPIASSDDAFGFRAFDGAALAGEEPLHISFRTSNRVDPTPPAVPSALGCPDLICQAFGQVEAGCDLPIASGCAAEQCHGAAETLPPMGLSLASPHGLISSALGRVAHQTETGPTTGRTLASPPRFGTAMALIEPGRPSNSYLVYKLLVAPDAYLPESEGDACSRYRAAADPERCILPAEEELTRLREWFVRGDPMPPPGHEPRFVHAGTARQVIDFIAAGASCR
jgi:hypothetical protein